MLSLGLIRKKFEPEGCFIQFLFDDPEFGDELCIASGSRCLAEIRGDARSGSQSLLAKNLRQRT